MNKSRPTRVGFLTNMYTPYKEAMFREIAKLVDLKVYYCAERESDRDWEVKFSGTYNYELLPGKTWNFGKRKLHYNPTIASRITADNIDVMIVGEWCNPTVIMLPFWLRWKEMPRLLWSGSTPLEKSVARFFTYPLKRQIVAQYQGFITYTQRAANYLESLGAPREYITVAPVTVDTDFFSAQRERLLQEPGRVAIRTDLGLDADDIVVVFVGQMIRRKGVDLLIEAIAALGKKRVVALLAGSGLEQESFEELAERRGVAHRIRFLGQCSQEDLARLYVAADVFTLPSRQEPSGNVINEAMTMGLPVVISDRVGCDCVAHGETGFVFEGENVSAYTRALKAITENTERYRVMGVAAREDLMSKFSIQIEANQFTKAVDALLSRLGYSFYPKAQINSCLNPEAQER